MNAAYRFGLKLASPYRIPGKPLVDEASVLARPGWQAAAAHWAKHQGNRYLNVPNTREGAMVMAAMPHMKRYGLAFPPGQSPHGGLDWMMSPGQLAYHGIKD